MAKAAGETKVIGQCKIGGNPHDIIERYNGFCFGFSYQCVPVGLKPCGYAWAGNPNLAKSYRRRAIKESWGDNPCVCGSSCCEHAPNSPTGGN